LPEGLTCSTDSPPLSLNRPRIYPPTTSQQERDLESCYLDIEPYYSELDGLLNYTVVQESIGLCLCDITDPRFAPYLEQDPSATVTSVPLNPKSLFRQQFCRNITGRDSFCCKYLWRYRSVSDPEVYPYSPNPCRNYASDDNDEEKGFQGWIRPKRKWLCW